MTSSPLCYYVPNNKIYEAFGAWSSDQGNGIPKNSARCNYFTMPSYYKEGNFINLGPLQLIWNEFYLSMDK